eukprot:scaffold57774_cov35-Phaeocystis_antarctica.AAC.2
MRVIPPLVWCVVTTFASSSYTSIAVPPRWTGASPTGAWPAGAYPIFSANPHSCARRSSSSCFARFRLSDWTQIT